jgi:hypothetical protein
MTASFTIRPAYKKRQQTANEILEAMQEIAAKFASIPKFEKIEVTQEEYDALLKELKSISNVYPDQLPVRGISLMGVPVYIKK